jgi:hypothetical protein
MAMSAIRPDIMAGPMLRISRPAKVDSLNPGASLSSAAIETSGAHTTSRKLSVSRFMEFPTINVLVGFENYTKSEPILVDQSIIAGYD